MNRSAEGRTVLRVADKFIFSFLIATPAASSASIAANAVYGLSSTHAAC
jgi:hypothetical protein